MKQKIKNEKLIRKILIVLLMALLSLNVRFPIFSEVTGVAGTKSTFKVEGLNGKSGKLTEIIEGADYGKTINYSVEVNGKTYDEWKVLYNDGNTVQIIMSDFLPQEGIPSEALSAGLEKVSGKTYNVNSSQSRDKLLAGLTTGWSDFAGGITGATATGAITSETIQASYLAKYGSLYWDSNKASQDTLYISHSSVYNDCYAYWTVSPRDGSATNGLWYLSCNGQFHGNFFNNTNNRRASRSLSTI